MTVSADGTVRHWSVGSGQGKWMSTMVEIPLEDTPAGLSSYRSFGTSAAAYGSGGSKGLSVQLGGSGAGTGAGSAHALKAALAGKLPHQLFACDYRPDAGAFATAGKDKAVRVYDASTLQLQALLSGGGSDSVTPGHSNRIFALAWHPTDPHLLLSAGWDGTMQVQDVRLGHAVRGMFGAHVCGDALTWLPALPSVLGGSEGSVFLTGSWRAGESVQAWDYGSGQCMGSLAWHGPGQEGEGGFVYALSASSPLSSGPSKGVCYVAGGGSGGNQVKLWRAGPAMAGLQTDKGGSTGTRHAMAGTLSGMHHAVYALDWCEGGMLPVVLDGRQGQAEGQDGVPPGEEGDAPLPTTHVPTLLVAGGEEPLRVFHILEGLAEEEACGSAGGMHVTKGRAAHGRKDGSTEGYGWTWEDGDALPAQEGTPASERAPGQPPVAPLTMTGGPAQGGAPHSLRRGSAALRAVMDARLQAMTTAPSPTAGAGMGAVAEAGEAVDEAALVAEYGGAEEEGEDEEAEGEGSIEGEGEGAQQG